MTTLQLSTVRPDFEDIVSQLQSYLSGKASWRDILTTTTGQTLLEFIAAVGALDQYAIASAFEETYPLSAKNESSIYAIALMLGVRLPRKRPATISTTMSVVSGTLTIPAYSQFSGAGSVWFNRTAISLTTSPQTVALYQGQVYVTTISGIGTDFQSFISPEANFSVSDVDVLVAINNVQVAVMQNGLWNAKAMSGVQDTTLEDGRLMLMFGNTLYGSKPASNDVVNITYAQTSGANGNQLATTGQTLNYAPSATVLCTATSNPTGGADETSALTFKSVAAPLFGAFGSAVTKRQYIATVQAYPGVVDALMFAQREIDPKTFDWMSQMKVVLLTSSSWTDAQKQTFLTTIQNESMYSPFLRLVDPVQAPVTVNIDVYCRSITADTNQVKTDVEYAITQLFTPSAGYLNKNIYKSDIIEAAMHANTNVEYVVLNSPTIDTILDSQAVSLPTLTQVVGGSLTLLGSYVYAVSYTSSLVTGAIVAPANWQAVTLTGANRSVQLTWPAVPNVASYQIWGRDTNGSNPLGLIASVSSSTLTFTDDGSVTPTPPIPSETTMPAMYATFGSPLTVNVHFSTRNRSV